MSDPPVVFPRTARPRSRLLPGRAALAADVDRARAGVLVAQACRGAQAGAAADAARAWGPSRPSRSGPRGHPVEHHGAHGPWGREADRGFVRRRPAVEGQPSTASHRRTAKGPTGLFNRLGSESCPTTDRPSTGQDGQDGHEGPTWPSVRSHGRPSMGKPATTCGHGATRVHGPRVRVPEPEQPRA
jgi:hypothetical protein